MQDIASLTNLSTFKNQIKTIALLGGLSALLIGIGALVAPNSLWIFGAIAVGMNLLSYFYSDKLVLAMSRAHPVDRAAAPGLYRIVEELSQRAGIPVPRIYVIEDPAPNAFATGRNPEHGVVAVTTGILQLLSERELRGVLAHELSHIRNRDILVASIAAMAASVISMIASIVKWGAIFGTSRDDDEGGNPVGALLMAIVAPIAATIIQLAISRSREYMADATGAQISGDPLALASALGKLERGNQRVMSPTAENAPATASLFICSPFSGGAIMRWFSTHPPIPERIRRLEELAAADGLPQRRRAGYAA
jgi:heat shock protein HtpX